MLHMLCVRGAARERGELGLASIATLRCLLSEPVMGL